MRNIFNIFKYEIEFRNLWTGYTFTVLDGWFSTIAVNLYVWNAYESAILSSVSLVINMVPTVFLGPILGKFIDNFDKKTLAIAMSILNCIILFLPMISPSIYTVCIYNFLNGVILCIRYPWLNSYLPLVVKEERLIDANAAISFSKTFGQLLMPLISSFLFAAVPTTMLFLLNLLFLMLAIVSFLQLPCLEHYKYGNSSKDYKTILSQIGYILLNKKISFVTLIMMIMLFIDGGVNLLLIMVTKSIFNMPDSYYGMLITIKGIGMTLASFGAVKLLLKFNINNLRLLYYLGVAKIGLFFLLGHIIYPIFSL